MALAPLQKADLPSAAAQAAVVNTIRTAARLSVAPIWHKINLNNDVPVASQIDFFTNLPQGGLNWWLANFRQPYIKQSLTIFGIRMYFTGDGTTPATGSLFRVSTGAEFIIGQQLPGLWNLIDAGLVKIKVNDTEHPYIDASKLLARQVYNEYGYDDGAGNASYATTFGVDSNSPYFVFKKPNREITPFIVSKDDEFSVTVRLPSVMPGAAAIPNDWHLAFELLCQVERTMYAG